jgi:flagellar protein FliO/FliZ
VQLRRSGLRARLRMRALLTVLLAAAVYACSASVAFAADGFEKDTTPLPSSVTDSDGGGGIATASSGGAAIARMVVGLAIVLAVVYGVYWLLKKRYGSSSGGKVADGRLEIVATTALAGNRAVHLLRAGDELFLIGSSEQSVTGLRSWGPEEALRLETVLAEPPPKPQTATQPVGFLDALRKLTVRT